MDIKTILQDERKKKFLIIGVGIFVLILGVILLSLMSSKTQEPQDEQSKILTDLAQLSPRDGSVSSGRTILPIITLSSSMPIVAPGNPSVISWKSDNAISCVDGSGNSLSTKGSISITPMESFTFDVICTNQKGTSFESTTVEVTNTPIIMLFADPESVPIGGTSLITWNTVNTTRCVDANSKTLRLSGSLNVVVKAPYTFKIDCVGPNGTGKKSITIGIAKVVVPAKTTQITNTNTTTTAEEPTTNVTKPVVTNPEEFGTGPEITIETDKTKVDPDEKATIKWSSPNATSCRGRTTSGATIEGEGRVAVVRAGTDVEIPTKGELKVGVLAGHKSATVFITCTGPSGTTTKTVTIYANTGVGITAAPKVTVTAVPNVFVERPGVSTVTWDATNSNECSATVSNDSWAEIKDPLTNKMVNIHDLPNVPVKVGGEAKLHVGTMDPTPGFEVAEECTTESGGATQCFAASAPQEATFTVSCKGPKGTGSGKATVRIVSQCEADKSVVGKITSVFGGGCDGSVICTELNRQGLISKETYEADKAYADAYISPELASVYHFWAIPFVRAMQKSDYITQVFLPYGTAWANHMAYEMGVVAEDNWLGKKIHSIFLPAHQKIANIFYSQKGTTPPTKDSSVKPTYFEIAALCTLFLTILSLFLIPVILILTLISLLKKIILKFKKE